MPESEQITHTALAIQIAEVKGSLNTIATLLSERSKSHNELADSHKTLSKTVDDLKVRVIQISTVGAILTFAMPGIWDKFLDRSHPQKNSGAIMPPALVRGRV
jgi:hypothetical protein